MTVNLTDPIFHDEDKARAHLEAIRWADGVSCPYCGDAEAPKKLGGKSMGKGWYHCPSCRKKFTVRVGTVYERSKVPLHKWLLATHLMVSSKKGVSAHQLHRMLGVTYKTAWFMAHRIREAMREPMDGGMGGPGKLVEADETYVGGKAKNAKHGKGTPKKEAVMTLVERGGRIRSLHIPKVSHKNVSDVLRTHIDRESTLVTDYGRHYRLVGREFADHKRVNHSLGEYVRGDAYTNTLESYYSLLKRGIMGSFHHVSQQHLKRYVGEFDFRWNYRKMTDGERATQALKGIEGKRLTYRRTNEACYA